MPTLITVNGPMASGKSTLTTLLRKELADYAYVDRPNIKRGLRALEQEEKRKLSKQAALYLTRLLMEEGYDIIVEEISAVSIRDRLADMIEGKGYRILPFRLHAPLEVTLERERQRRPQGPLLDRVRELYDGLQPTEGEIVIDTSAMRVEESLGVMLEHVYKG
ncbi:AAA family ATPase [Candidatus Woesearchaeota archaeon]|nr:AAA family ATPase [Candidatus Woesearchaeota archaeon]